MDMNSDLITLTRELMCDPLRINNDSQIHLG